MGISSSSQQVRRNRQRREAGEADLVDAFRSAIRLDQPRLLFGTEAIPHAHAPPVPTGPMMLYVDYTNPPPTAEVQKTVMVKNPTRLQRDSVRLVPSGRPDAYFLEFKADLQLPTMARVHLAVVEMTPTPAPSEGGPAGGGGGAGPDPQQPQQATMDFRPQRPELFPLGFPVAMAPGIDTVFRSEQPIAMGELEGTGARRFLQELPNLFPLVITLQPEGGPEGLQNSSTHQLLSTYAEFVLKGEEDATLETPAGSAGPSPGEEDQEGECPYQVRVLAQRLAIHGQVFNLEEIYGAPGAEGEEGEPDPDAVDNSDVCVVCLSDTRDTTILPCRHMCLCGDCAEMLRRQTNRCPICRTKVERLVTLKLEEGDVA